MKPNIFDHINSTEIDLNLQVNVKRYFTDIDGQIVSKSTVPANLQVSYPFYLFHKFDKNGGFRIGQTIKPPLAGAKFYYMFDVDLSFDYWQISGNNTVRNQLRSGDTCIIFADSVTAPTYLIWVVISCPFQAYASIIDNLGIDKFKVTDFLYQSDNVENYNEALHINVVDPIGVYSDEQYAPLSFKTRDTVLQDFILIKLGLKLNSRLGIFSYFNFNTELLTFIFNIKI